MLGALKGPKVCIVKLQVLFFFFPLFLVHGIFLRASIRFVTFFCSLSIINWVFLVNLDEYKIPKKYISGLEQLKSGKKKK